jgi:hypothetical protein
MAETAGSIISNPTMPQILLYNKSVVKPAGIPNVTQAVAFAQGCGRWAEKTKPAEAD